jgi:hypothetical protein
MNDYLTKRWHIVRQKYQRRNTVQWFTLGPQVSDALCYGEAYPVAVMEAKIKPQLPISRDVHRRSSQEWWSVTTNPPESRLAA